MAAVLDSARFGRCRAVSRRCFPVGRAGPAGGKIVESVSSSTGAGRLISCIAANSLPAQSACPAPVDIRWAAGRRYGRDHHNRVIGWSPRPLASAVVIAGTC